MNQTKSNILIDEVLKKLWLQSSELNGAKHLCSVISQSLSLFIRESNYCDETSAVIRLCEEKLTACINGCMSTSIELSNKVSLDLALESYRKNILNNLHDAISIIVIVSDALNYNEHVITESDKAEKENYLTTIGSIATVLDSLYDQLQNKFLESLYEDFNKLEKMVNVELENANSN